jgi:hypothetical protein
LVTKKREERRLRLLKRIFGPTKDEVIGEWKTLHNEIINDLDPQLTSYYSGDRFEKNEMGGLVARMVEMRGAYRVLERKPEGKGTTWKTQA